ncbi:hypothetical protein VCRA2122O12_360030 [Vibrio crassostreae]|nr:hypothetical protein VCRA2114E5_330009 [Vibrio crassostreae]CAK2015504.1 hypothetical protein VCRA2110O4_350031 [Vibrio crassostreae]CAK2019888.1 hypothetical protein VCRA2110O1_360009 [Vibrio crassostreae]CAK2802762.1 hypothetical protein VCRA2110O3_340010 [Vibrio crassostreae]CAK2823256.1 hypothetical protein VCRA2110O2_350009 [Vibrio crassostreae]
MNGLSLLDQISVIRDPRQAWKIEHTLTDIIFLAISAVIAIDGNPRRYIQQRQMLWCNPCDSCV